MAKKSESKIKKIKPREVTGRDVIERFHFQYRKAAEASLMLLENDSYKRLFSDYFDDYVLEKVENSSSVYIFCQVKTKRDAKHQYNITEIFGVNKDKATRPASVSKSFAAKLFHHKISFGCSCKEFHFITNVFIDDDIESLLKDLRNNNFQEDKLTGKSAKIYKKIEDPYRKAFNKLDSNFKLSSYLKDLLITQQAGLLDSATYPYEIAQKIYKYSEVDITTSQMENIANNLIQLVYKKSLEAIPNDISEVELQRKTSIELSDILPLLSISESGYLEFKNNGDEHALKSASRLHKIMDLSHAPTTIHDLCFKMKVAWDNWYRTEKHTFLDSDYAYLIVECEKIIDRLIARQLNHDSLQVEIDSLTNKMKGKINYGLVLDKDLIFGCFLNLAIKREIYK